VAVSTISRRDRSAKHLAVARHLESLEDEELSGLVAAHYLEAHQAAPEGPEAEVIALGARDWLSRAGQRALSLGSPEQALAFFEQALQVTPASGERAALLVLAGEAAAGSNDTARALLRLEEAVGHYEAIGALSAVGRVTAILMRNLERYSDALERGERVFKAIGEAPGTERARAALAREMAAMYSATGEARRALEWAETALVLAEQLDDPGLLAGAIGAKASSLFNLGRHREAVILARGQVQLAATAGVLREQANGLLYLSVFIIDDDLREALSASMESAELARRAGQRGVEVMDLRNAAETSFLLGEWGDTRSAIIELRPRDVRPDQVAYLDCVEAMLLACTGAASQAAALIDSHAEQLAAAEAVAVRATYLRARSVVSLAGGDIEAARLEAAAAVSADPFGINSPHALAMEARAALWLSDSEGAREALSAMAGFRGRWMAAARLTTEAGLAALDGRVEESAEAYRAAIESWRTLGCTLDLAMCELDLVLLLGPDDPDASAAKEARDIFTQLGARPFLARLDRAASAED
ncbi:MAG: hypothetical protein ABSD97_11425, partial [Acidimicrobiales bacterium]